MENRENMKKSLLLSLKKISGMTEKLSSMVESEESCLLTVQQMDAAIGLLRSARKKLVLHRLEECFRRGVKSKSDEDFKEIMRLYEACK